MIKKYLKYIPFLITILVILSISYFRLFENYELATLDLRYKLRPSQHINPDIVIIEIGDDSIEKIGRWPFDRNWHATLLDILAHQGVKAVFFDSIFSEKKAGDRALIEVSKKLDVYYPFAFELSSYEKDRCLIATRYAAALLEKFGDVAKGTGHINIVPDRDGKIRRIPLFIRYEEELYPAVALVLACDYLGIPQQEFKIPVDKTSTMLLNYPAKWKDSFHHLSYIDIIVSRYLEYRGRSGVVNLNDLKDKVCFVGLTATGTHDISPIPLESLYPGIGIQASIFNTLVTNSFIVRVNRMVNLFIAILLALVVARVSMRLRPRKSLICSSLFVIFFIVLAFGLFAFFRIWIDLFFPVILMATIYLYATFNRYTVERKKRELIEKELSIAQSIQRSFLPDSIPETKDLEIEADMLTAHHVGGDLYDFVDYKDEALAVMIGDVSGKGVPAALFMAKIVSEFRIFSKDEREPAKVLKSLNGQLLETSKTNLFVTMSHLFFDMQNKKLTFASGGHLPIILSRGKGMKTLSAEEGMALGLFESEFTEKKLDLLPGDLLVLYTDGVTEAVNAKGEEFGMEQLLETVKSYKDLSCKEIVNLIQKELKNFSGKAPQHDDITVIAIKIL